MPETINQKDLIKCWDNLAGKKEFTSDLDVDKLYEFVSEDASILDFGCGYGRLYPIVTKKKPGIKYVGYDPATKMVEEAKNRFPHVTFFNNLDSLSADYPDGFDAILLISVLTAVPSNNDQKSLLSNICNYLKPNGHIIVNDFLVNRDQRNIDRYGLAREKYHQPYGVFELEDGLLLRHHTEIYLHTLMEDCFEVKSFENGVFKTMNGNFSNAAKIIAKKK